MEDAAAMSAMEKRRSNGHDVDSKRTVAVDNEATLLAEIEEEELAEVEKSLPAGSSNVSFCFQFGILALILSRKERGQRSPLITTVRRKRK